MGTMHDKLKVYERIIVASVFFTDKVKEYALEQEIDLRFFKVSLNNKVMRIFNSLANGSVEPNVALMMAQLDPPEEEREGWEIYFEGLKKDATDLETVKMYLDMLKKRYKIDRYLNFVDELKDLVESEKINPLSADFEDMDKEIDHKFSSLLEEYSGDDKKEMNMSEGVNHVMGTMHDSLHSDISDIVTTGYEDLDKVYNGGHLKGTYSIIAARPAMG